MTVACIIQARLRSTRLPAKVLLPLPTGRTVLEEVIYRCKQIKGVDAVVVAIPDTPENDIIASVACRTAVVRGPEHDVLARYAKAASEVNADVIMRITSDCPLVDPEVSGQVLRLVGGVGYASNCWPAREHPHGLDCEVFTRDLLSMANNEATDAYDREHVTPFIQRNCRVEGSALLKSMVDRSHIRWTLDTIEDYVTIWDEFQRREKEAA